jgi:hypothetical protein
MELNRFKQLLESTMGNVKPLIMEQPTGTTKSIFDECFTKQGIPLDELPQSCKDMINNKAEVNSFYGRCSSDLMNGEFYKPELPHGEVDKVGAALDCVSEKLISTIKK